MRKAQVTSISPLEVRREGERLPVPAIETNQTLAIFDDVLVETIDNQVYVIIRLGAATTYAPLEHDTEHDDRFSQLGHDHATTYAALEHDTEHDDRFSQLGHTHAAELPVGVILLWSGSVASIPSGWQLCNGANGTPDLRDRFVVGAGSSYSVDGTGGSDGHTHSSGTHTHFPGSLAADADGVHDHGGVTAGGVASRRGVTEAGTNNENFASHSHDISNSSTHTHSVSGNTGVQSTTVPIGTGDTGIVPPYYALAYIQKMS